MAFKKTFVISDESVNSYGFKILTAGIDLTQANKNLPAFYNHRTWEMPIGHWENLKKNNKGQLTGDLVIEGENEEEKEYIRKIQNGDIKGASGGFDPLTWNEDPAQLSQGQTRPTLEKCVLFEASLTPLPSNNDCLALKSSDGLLSLSDGNKNNLIPELKSEPDMKQIALKLGLAETATEQQILEAIAAIQLNNANAEALRLHVEAQAKETLETTEEQELFVELSKTSVKTALSFLQLQTKKIRVEAITTEVAPGTIKKDVTLTSLVKEAKAKNEKSEGADAGKDTYDYLQKHNQVELTRIHKEEPARYTQLAKDYNAGVRYTGGK